MEIVRNRESHTRVTPTLQTGCSPFSSATSTETFEDVSPVRITVNAYLPTDSKRVPENGKNLRPDSTKKKQLQFSFKQ